MMTIKKKTESFVVKTHRKVDVDLDKQHQFMGFT